MRIFWNQAINILKQIDSGLAGGNIPQGRPPDTPAQPGPPQPAEHPGVIQPASMNGWPGFQQSDLTIPQPAVPVSYPPPGDVAAIPPNTVNENPPGSAGMPAPSPDQQIPAAQDAVPHPSAALLEPIQASFWSPQHPNAQEPPFHQGVLVFPPSQGNNNGKMPSPPFNPAGDIPENSFGEGTGMASPVPVEPYQVIPPPFAKIVTPAGDLETSFTLPAPPEDGLPLVPLGLTHNHTDMPDVTFDPWSTQTVNVEPNTNYSTPKWPIEVSTSPKPATDDVFKLPTIVITLPLLEHNSVTMTSEAPHPPTMQHEEGEFEAQIEYAEKEVWEKGKPNVGHGDLGQVTAANIALTENQLILTTKGNTEHCPNQDKSRTNPPSSLLGQGEMSKAELIGHILAQETTVSTMLPSRGRLALGSISGGSQPGDIKGEVPSEPKDKLMMGHMGPRPEEFLTLYTYTTKPQKAIVVGISKHKGGFPNPARLHHTKFNQEEIHLTESNLGAFEPITGHKEEGCIQVGSLTGRMPTARPTYKGSISGGSLSGGSKHGGSYPAALDHGGSHHGKGSPGKFHLGTYKPGAIHMQGAQLEKTTAEGSKAELPQPEGFQMGGSRMKSSEMEGSQAELSQVEGSRSGETKCGGSLSRSSYQERPTHFLISSVPAAAQHPTSTLPFEGFTMGNLISCYNSHLDAEESKVTVEPGNQEGEHGLTATSSHHSPYFEKSHKMTVQPTKVEHVNNHTEHKENEVGWHNVHVIPQQPSNLEQVPLCPMAMNHDQTANEAAIKGVNEAMGEHWKTEPQENFPQEMPFPDCPVPAHEHAEQPETLAWHGRQLPKCPSEVEPENPVDNEHPWYAKKIHSAMDVYKNKNLQQYQQRISEHAKMHVQDPELHPTDEAYLGGGQTKMQREQPAVPRPQSYYDDGLQHHVWRKPSWGRRTASAASRVPGFRWKFNVPGMMNQQMK